MEGRIGRSFLPSACDEPNFFPGDIGLDFRYFEIIGPFCNQENSTTCVTVDFFSGNCTDANNPSDVLVIPTAYSEFNSDDLQSGYLGTIGLESPNQFRFTLGAEEQFFVIGQAVRGINATQGDGTGCEFSVLVEFDDECGR